jgi:hypothetical protein
MPLLATRSPTRNRPLLAAFAALMLGLALRAGAAAPSWSVEITPEGELFPVLDLSQMPPKSSAAPGGGNGLVLVRVAPGRHVRVEVDTPGLLAPAVVEADPGGKTVDLRPRLAWDRGYLESLRSPSRQTLRVTFERSGRPAQTRDVPVRVHPLDDALYFVREGSDRVDLGWVFAAYVDPEDPAVDDVLDLARSLDPDFEMPAESAGDRVRKAASIWAALVAHGLRYAAGDPALSRGPAIYSQRVRRPGDVWRERRANCLDGSVLIASVLERIGIPAFIVLVPGHAFVGYRTSARGLEFLETTLLGNEARSARSRVAPGSFEAAREAGRARWRRVEARFGRHHGPDYALIDIGAARSYGIIPLGAHGDDGEGGTHADPATAAGLPRTSSPP